MNLSKLVYYLRVGLLRNFSRLTHSSLLQRSRRIYEESSAPSLYHVHVRKTGGTSINHAIFQSYTNESTDDLEERLRQSPLHRIITDRHVIVGWSKKAINEGHFNFGYSHVPLEELSLPKETVTFTCLRDPIQRLFSHYRMLVGYIENNVDKPCVKLEGDWARGTFMDFLRTAPRHALENQLYMFSRNFEVDEAFERIGSCNYILFFDRLSDDLRKMGREINLQLELPHKNKSSTPHILSDSDAEEARKLLKAEYTFFQKVKEKYY